MARYSNLEVYKRARSMNRDLAIFMTSRKLEFYIRNQLSRAALSVMLNIAEGSTRMSDSDQRRFYVIARSSLNEVNALFDHLEDISPDDAKALNTFRDQAVILSKMLLKLIRTLE